MCAIASTTCFLTFFFFGSAKSGSSIYFSIGSMTKAVVIAHSQQLVSVNSRPEVLCYNRIPLPLSEGTNPNSLSLNWSSWALPRTRIRACSLAAQRKTASVADPPITAKVHQAFDVHRDFAPEVTLDNEIGNGRSQFGDFGFCQILHCHLRINAGRGTDFPRS